MNLYQQSRKLFIGNNLFKFNSRLESANILILIKTYSATCSTCKIEKR